LKKERKNFLACALTPHVPRMAGLRGTKQKKFFGSFFQTITLSCLCLRSPDCHAMADKR
jgi:hypothetical protein